MFHILSPHLMARLKKGLYVTPVVDNIFVYDCGGSNEVKESSKCCGHLIGMGFMPKLAFCFSFVSGIKAFERLLPRLMPENSCPCRDDSIYYGVNIEAKRYPGENKGNTKQEPNNRPIGNPRCFLKREANNPKDRHKKIIILIKNLDEIQDFSHPFKLLYVLFEKRFVPSPELKEYFQSY